MSLPPEATLLALYFNGLLTLVVATIAYLRQRMVRASVPFFLIMLAASWWSVTYAIMLSRSDVLSKVFWANTTYFAIVFIPILWLFFALEYAGLQRWATRRSVILLLLMPVATLVVIWSNPWTGWFWRYVAPATSGGRLSGLITEWGFWFFIHTGYSYLCLLTGSLILGSFLFSGRANLYRGQILALLIAVLAPWVGNAIYVFQLVPGLNIDPTPFAFAITGISITWAFYQYRLFELVPAAHDAVLNSMSDGVVVLDRKDYVIEANPAAQQFMRLANPVLGQVVGRSLGELMALWPQALERFRDEAHISTTTLPLAIGNHLRYIDLRVSPLKGSDGSMNGRIIVTSDVTAREMAAELQKAKERAEAASQAKSAFLASMSHELRTPLNHIIGYSEILLEDAADHQAGEYAEDLRKIQSAGRHLLGMITQILELSKLEAGMTAVQLEDFDPGALLEDAAMAVQMLVEQNGNTLVLDLAKAGPSLRNDPTKLRLALLALLSNAARFTRQGRVSIAAHRIEAAGVEQLQVEVADTGPGIPPERMETLFTAFATPDHTKRSKDEGLGLGLATAWHLCRLMGGALSAASEVGQGSTFIIAIPIQFQVSVDEKGLT
jgi:signal transduction histidine kinase